MIVNPRRFIEKKEELINSLTTFAGSHEEVYLWGAGKLGKYVKDFLEEINIHPKGFIVSKVSNERFYLDLPIMQYDEMSIYGGIGIVLSLGNQYHEEVLSNSNLDLSHMFIPSQEMYEIMGASQRIISDYRVSALEKLFPYKIKLENISLRDWREILIICIENIGDVIMYLPFIRELRKNCALDVNITVVVQPQVKIFMELCPYIDTVIVYDYRKYFASDIHGAIEISKMFSEAHLCQVQYDVVFIQGWYNIHIESLLLAVFSSATVRVGFSETNMPAKAILNRNFDKFLSVAIKSTAPMHEVERNLYIVKFLRGKVYSSGLDFWHTAEDERLASKILSGVKLGDEGKMIAIVPYANDPRRVWDKHNYLELLLALHGINQKNYYLILGGVETVRIGDYLIKESNINNIINLAGKTSLGIVSAVIKRCSLYIGSNTGLTHIAAAWKVPVIEIICHPVGGDPLEYSSPIRYHAWETKYSIVRPDHALPGCGATCYSETPHCINLIKADDVLSTIKCEHPGIINSKL